MAWKYSINPITYTIEGDAGIEAAWPTTNLLNLDPFIQCRATGTASYEIDFDLGTQDFVGHIVIYDTNVSSILIQVSTGTGNDDGVTFGTTYVATGAPVQNEYTGVYSYCSEITTLQRRYWRISLGSGHSAIDGLGYYHTGYTVFTRGLAVEPQFVYPFNRVIETGGKATRGDGAISHASKQGLKKETLTFNSRYRHSNTTERAKVLPLARYARNQHLIIADLAEDVAHFVVGRLDGNVNSVRSGNNIVIVQGMRIKQV